VPQSSIRTDPVTQRFDRPGQECRGHLQFLTF